MAGTYQYTPTYVTSGYYTTMPNQGFMPFQRRGLFGGLFGGGLFGGGLFQRRPRMIYSTVPYGTVQGPYTTTYVTTPGY
jgi:hypothetical protein